MNASSNNMPPLEPITQQLADQCLRPRKGNHTEILNTYRQLIAAIRCHRDWIDRASRFCQRQVNNINGNLLRST
ncbi:hypothetical protein TMatcc_005270 [Talaromyces marneffei ATCC 18224]